MYESGVDARHETIPRWRHRFGPTFDPEMRTRCIEGMRSSRWRWHLDEMLVKINGEIN